MWLPWQFKINDFVNVQCLSAHETSTATKNFALIAKHCAVRVHCMCYTGLKIALSRQLLPATVRAKNAQFFLSYGDFEK